MNSNANQWLTLEEAASALKVPAPTVQQLVDGGALGAVTLGDQVRIPAVSLQRYAASAERAALGRRFRSSKSLIAASAVGVLLAAAGVFAASAPNPGEIVPRQIPYRGVLNQDGAPVTNTSVPMEFRLYYTEEGGASVWSETQNVSVMDGEFHVALGDVTPIPAALFAQPSLFLGVQVSGVDLLGRQQLLSVPYAQQAMWSSRSNLADNATRATSAASVDSLPAGAVMFFNKPTCPAGWTEVPSARGRTLVGLHPGGGLAAVVGTPFGNGENRVHAHGMTHNHSVGITSQNAFSHYWDRKGQLSSGYEGTGYFVMDTMSDEVIGEQHDHYISGSTGSYTGNTAATNDQLAYIQLLVCQKT